MTHRTALITAGSIAAVVFAGAIAMGVNLGILTVADSSPIGKLSAVSTQVRTDASREIQVYTGATSSQKYIIRKAGSVEIAVTKGGVRLLGVSAKRHWTWSLAQAANRKLTVTFHSQATTYLFMATLGRHGTIVARVDQPITRTVTGAAPVIAASVPAVSTSAAAAATSSSTAASPNSARSTPAQGGETDNNGGGQDD